MPPPNYIPFFSGQQDEQEEKLAFSQAMVS